jgi:two-component system chemotaxis response regulator CheY
MLLFDRSAPVLLVEPRATAFLIISDLLGQLGFQTIEPAQDSTTALDMLKETGPRLVIADMHIEPTNALQFLRLIRSDDRLRRTPFIIASESLSAVEARAIKDAGVDSFLLKPFRPEALEAKIEAAYNARPKPRPVLEPVIKKGWKGSIGRRFERYNG